MDNEKKKSRLIRLLGKLGGKVRFLRKPLMVIAVVCVSIHHLIRQLFFDVKYHTARMRLITGAMCVALLFTLFVIPAIADEVFEIGTEIEILDSEEPTAEPIEQAPIIENEQPEEPNANQAEPEDDNDDQTYDDQTDSNDGQGDANAPTDDTNNNANDDVTYDVDDEGNLIDPETGETVKNSGIAARRRDGSVGGVSFSASDIKIKKGTGSTATDAASSYTYNFGAIPEGEVFSVKVIVGDTEIAQTSLERKWILKKETTTGGTTTTTTIDDTETRDFYTLPSRDGLAAGTYKLHCEVVGDVGSYESSSEITITVNKAQLTRDNILWSGSGIEASYFVTASGDNSPIPTTAPDTVWVGTTGDISANYTFLRKSDNSIVAEPWTQPGEYYVRVDVSSAENYDISDNDHKLFLFRNTPTFTVSRYTYSTGDPYDVAPTASGEFVSGGSGPRWFKKNDVDSTDGKVTIKPKTDFVMSETVGGTYDSDGVDPIDSSSASGQGPQTLYFKYMKVYGDQTYYFPVYDEATNNPKAYPFNASVYLDKDLPQATVTLKQNGATIGTGSFTKSDVTLEVTNLTDVGSGIYLTSDTTPKPGVWYHFDRNQRTASGIAESEWTLGTNGSVTTTDYPSGKIYVYVRVKDKAGNYKYYDETYVTMDTNAPVITSDSSKKPVVAGKTYYVATGQKKYITVSDKNQEKGDAGLLYVGYNIGTSTTVNNSTVDVSAKIGSDGKECKIDYAPPTTDTATYTIIAKDKSDNTTTVTFIIAKAETDIDVTKEIVFGNANTDDPADPNGSGGFNKVTGREYGYEDDDASLKKAIKIWRYRENDDGTTTDNCRIVIKDAELLPGSDDFVISDDHKTVYPKNRLGVGIHSGVVLVKYVLLAPDETDATPDPSGSGEIIYENTATVNLSFIVVKAPLTATYMGNTEYFHSIADFTLKGDDPGEKEDTDEMRVVEVGGKKIALKVEGFKYGQGKTIVPETGVYTDPTVSVPDAVKTNDADLHHHLAPDATMEITPAGGTATNYYFKERNPGFMKCVRREIPGSYSLLSSEGGVGENGWFTGLVVFKPSAGFTLYDVSNYFNDDKNSPKNDNYSYLPDIKNSDTGAPIGSDTYISNNYKANGMYFIDETTGIKKQFYVYNTETEEISSLMETDPIKIDHTAPHQFYTHDENSVKSDSGGIGYKWDGKLIDKKANRPYLRVDASDPWYEFWHTVTFGLYFNDRTTVVVENAIDDISGIQSVYYHVAGKDTGDYVKPDKRDDWSDSGIVNVPDYDEDHPETNGWHRVSPPDSNGQTSFKVDKSVIDQAHIDEGYLYVRIKNNAGLVTYLTIYKTVIFDSEGPSITTSVKPTNRISSPNTEGKYVVASADEFIAEEVQFTIHDTNLHKATTEKPEHSVVVYEGYNISNSGTIVSDAVSPTGSCVFDNPNKEQSWTVTLKCGHWHDRQCKEASSRNYTIVARDDSGFETIRYFTITKPVYDIELDKVVVPSAVYGYTAASLSPQQLVQKPMNQETGAGWRNTSAANADAIIENMEYVQGGDNFEPIIKDGDKWIVKPKTSLDVGNYSAILKVTYKDTDGEHKTAPKELKTNVFFNVTPKVLTATYEGGTILRGKTSDASKNVKVTGFIEGQDATNASGYKAPVVNIPAGLKQTTIIKPEGGSADNYTFEYVGGILTVVSREAEKNTHYTVSGTQSNSGWFTSNITLTPKTGYVMTSDADGKLTMPNIVITEDTAGGEKKFYIKENKDNGEIYNETSFQYKKDTIAPLISGVVDGGVYVANKKEVTVTDANLSRVSVNGSRMDISQGKSVFNLLATQKEKVCFIAAEDFAGHITTATVTLKQEDGTEDPDLEDDLDDDPDDDRIQDDTDGGDDGDLGSFTKKVQLVDGAPATTFTSSNKELKNYVLNTSEREVLKEGSDVNVKLRVQNIDGSVSQADKELVIAALGDYTVAKYLDVTLWKTVGSGEEVGPIAKTKKAISMTVTIPSEFRKAVKSGKVREFAFVRVHNGAAAVLEDQDGSANTITVSSSLYSVYALAYRDVDASSAKSQSDSGGGGKSKSDGTSNGAGRSGRGSGSGSGSGSGGGSGSGSGGGYGSVRTNGVSVETDGIIDGSPQTGDRAPILPTALGFGLSFIGMITVLVLRKKFDYEWVYVDDAGNYYDRKGNPVDSSMYEDV